MTGSLAAVARHLWGLFVDDGGMAAAILAWLALNAALAQLAIVPPVWRGPLLVAGLFLLLAWTCLRAARRRI